MKKAPTLRILSTRFAQFAGIFLLPLIAQGIASAEWKPLFNGNNFDGWTQLGGVAKYHIEEGAIVGTSVPDTPNSFLTSDKHYGNFILKFEVKVDDGLNSGVQFRSNSKPDYRDGRVHGYQYELDTSYDRSWSAGIYDEARRGWLYPVDYNMPAKSLFKHNDWNQARIECLGNEIRTYLNGQLVSRLIDSKTASGFIGLQVHGIGKNRDLVGKQVRWRDLQIKENIKSLPKPSPIFTRNLILNTLDGSEKDQGWKLLFNGKNLDGWNSPDTGWVVKDGILKIMPTPEGQPKHGDLLTKEKFGAFELQLEFYMTPKANSGIKYFVDRYEEVDSGKKATLGLEYQILDDERHPDAKNGVVGNRTCASLYDLIPSYQRVYNRKVPRGVESWHHARIVVMPDNTVQHWLNGFKVVEYDRGSNIYDALVARSKYNTAKNFGLAEEGRILLQDHRDEVHFRSIKIRRL